MTDTFHTLPPLTVRLNGNLYPVTSPVGYDNLARIENRIVIGNPTEDDDQLLSTKVNDDFSAGCGIFDEREGADTGTFWDAEAVDIDHPGQLALGPHVQQFTISGTNAFVLGESGGKVHVSFDKNIYTFDEGTDTFSDSTVDLAFDPVNKGVNFHGKLWIPEGSHGYETFINPATKAAGTAGITPVAFAIWDNKIVCIEHDNQLSYWNPLTGAWTSPATAILESSQTPVDVIVYVSRADEPSVYVQTTEALWGYDDVSQVFVRTNVILPKHPDNGKGVAVWRTGETLYIPQSLFVWAWTGPGGTFDPGGPGTKQGIPKPYQGAIVSLIPTLNHLYALIDASSSGSYHSLYRYNGMGWVRVWAHTNASDGIHWGMNTGVASTQRVWWDAGNTIFSIHIVRTPTQSRELVTNDDGMYAASGYLITSWFDANMKTFQKLVAYDYADMVFGSATATLTADYQLSRSDADAYPGTWTNALTVADSGLFYDWANLSMYQMRFRYGLSVSGYANTDGSQKKSPVMAAHVLKHVKLPTPLKSFRVTFDLNFEGQRYGRDAQTMANELTDLLRPSSFLLMEHNQNQLYVMISSENGWDETAEDRRKSRTETFVQIPYPGANGPFQLA